MPKLANPGTFIRTRADFVDVKMDCYYKILLTNYM